MHTSSISALPGAWKDPAAISGIGTASAGAADAGKSFGSTRHAVLRVVTAEVLGALGQDASTHRLRGHRDGHDGARDHGAAGAVARSLQSAVARGEDPQVLLAKVQEGLQSAQTALADRGFDPAQVAAAASQFTSRVASLLGGGDETSPAEPANSSLSASVQIARKERGSLTLTTQDGDVLRIRFRSSERQKLEMASVDTGNVQATGVQLSASERTRTRVDVQGSLDAGELEAIEDFVGKVDALANEFFDGDVEAAFAAAASLDFDAGEIAGFSLKLSVSERVQASAVVRGPAPAPAPVAGVQAPLPSNADPVIAASPASAGDAAPVTAANPSLPAEPGTPAAATSSGDPLGTVQNFVRKAFDIADTPLSVSGFRLAWSAKLQLVAEAVAVAAPGGADKPGATLLNDVLGEAAGAAGADAPQSKLAEAA